MKTIQTKYLPPTYTQGERFKAYNFDSGVSITTLKDKSISERLNHVKIAMDLATQLGWTGRYVAGNTKDGMVWVNSDGPDSFLVGDASASLKNISKE